MGFSKKQLKLITNQIECSDELTPLTSMQMRQSISDGLMRKGKRVEIVGSEPRKLRATFMPLFERKNLASDAETWESGS
jgi:hypothetical protein